MKLVLAEQSIKKDEDETESDLRKPQDERE
jgi:hypothetical protein